MGPRPRLDLRQLPNTVNLSFSTDALMEPGGQKSKAQDPTLGWDPKGLHSWNKSKPEINLPLPHPEAMRKVTWHWIKVREQKKKKTTLKMYNHKLTFGSLNLYHLWGRPQTFMPRIQV